MNNEIDETKFTAYALDELDESERRAIESRLEHDPAARAELDQIRRVAGLLKEELAAEALPQRSAPVRPGYASRPPRWRSRLAVAAAVAAVLSAGVGAVIWRTHSQPRPIVTSTTRTVPAAKTTVTDLKAQARRLINETRYQEALGVLDQILKIDPTNDYAVGLRPLVEDKALLQQQRRFREDFDRQFTKQLNGAEEKKVPYDDILRYPSNWPDISEVRDSERTRGDALTLRTQPPAPAAPQQQLADAYSGTTTVNGGTLTVNGGKWQGQPAQKKLEELNTSFYAAKSSGSAVEIVRGGVQSSSTLAVRGTRVELEKGLVDAPQQPRGIRTGLFVANPEVAARDSAKVRGDFEADGDLDLKARNEDITRFNTEAYDRVVDNAFLEVAQNPLSTFSIDVDTASYSNVRRFLLQGQRPPKDAVRIEELVNYFPYDYAPPQKKDKKEGKPFAARVEVAACPWEPKHRLVRVALKGKEIAADKRPASNLVFLIDVSGSMNEPNKLPLVKHSMQILAEQLGGEDRVAMVVYAGNSGLVLPSTSCSDSEKGSILNALDNLQAGGSTNGGQGIELAYKVAQQNFIKGGTNRVILCTDGDFNVGVTNQGDLTRLIEDKAKGGVFLSVLGFGMGNLKDSTMEKLADKGNGNYAYIDTLTEAKKVLVEQMSGTLVTIAKDVKIQIEFNPAVVGGYRLIGYENRLLAKEDFNDDKKDAGEIGAGHAVTAMYEIVPAGQKAPETKPVDELKYQKPGKAIADDANNEMLTLKLRYKQPDGDKSTLMEVPVKDADATFAKSSGEFKFASAVAAFGMILRDSPHKGSSNYSAVLEWAQDGLGKDSSGYRHEFIDLVKRARSIDGK